MDADSLLVESIPPRYALESDEEDELNPLRSRPEKKQADNQNNVSVVLDQDDVPIQRSLIIANGDAGKIWASGVDLGEEKGAVYINDVKVAFVFDPSWTQSTVVVSESHTRLPFPAMHPYAEAILKTLKPTSVTLLDTYPLPTYATNHPKAFHEAPLRYLSTNKEPNFFESSGVRLFEPPNLIQSTSASFLAILSQSSVIGTLILLPSLCISAVRPIRVSPNNPSTFEQDEDEWSRELLNKVHRLLFQIIGEDRVLQGKAWSLDKKGEIKNRVPRKKTEIGYGGMYI